MGVMQTAQPKRFRFRRTDAWREGKWLDLWSVVHLLSGFSTGFCIFALGFDARASVALAFVLFVAYELWEAMVRIEEAPTNRFMDVVVGMLGFVPAFFSLAPALSGARFWGAFAALLIVNIVLAAIGWIASQKAAELEKRLRARYERERDLIRERRKKFRARFKK